MGEGIFNRPIKVIESPRSMKVMNVVITVAAVISVISAGYIFYKNKIWRPRVAIKNVDWRKGYANLIVNGHLMELYAGSAISASADWAIRFNNAPDGDELPDRIELVKNDIVYKNLLIKEG